MAAENFLINDRSNRQAVKTVRESLPEFNVIPPFTLIVKTIYPVYTGTLMITAQQEEVLWIFDFVSQ